jgi:short-chain dehydrogenase/reductase SDR
VTETNLSGKVAVVTGGSGVLCGEFCRALAKAGAKVAVIGSRIETASKVTDLILAEGGEALAVACNLLDEESIVRAEAYIREVYGPCDILINGAGIAPASASTTGETASAASVSALPEEELTLFNLPAEAFAKVMDLNVLSMFKVTKVFAAHMVGEEGACILNISSMSGISPLTKQIAYSASKAAVSNMTRWLATHLAEVGIRVNAIAPGFFATHINRHLLMKEDGSYTDRSQKILRGTPMGRFGIPEELVGAMLFLCDSTVSGFVTGVVLPVDGGFSAYCGV